MSRDFQSGEPGNNRSGPNRRRPEDRPARSPQSNPIRLPRAFRPELLKLPGLAAISLYMMVLAGVNVFGVMHGQIRPLLLVFSVVFIAAALGLLLLLRWAWNLTLAAVALLAGSFLWRFSSQHEIPFILQGLLNLVFFLYLVRPEVREKLR